MPIEIEDYGEITDVVLENGYMTYVCTIDEDECTMDELSESSDETREVIKTEYTTDTTENVRLLVEWLIKANIGIAYKYVGATSGEELLITVPYQDLEQTTQEPIKEDNEQ